VSSVELYVPLPSFVSGERRELVDLDELDLDRCEDLIGTITIPDSTPRSRHVGRIWALNVDGAHAGILDLLQRVNPTARVIDLAMQQDTFSSMFNMTHQDILGNRLLLKYEPTIDYEEIVKKFVRELQQNVDSIAILIMS